MNTKHIEYEAMRLSPEDRARLALELIESLEELAQSEVECLWLEESARRAGQIDAKTVELVPGDVVAREARALLKQ
jgi:predicted acyltransferase (DUF342 family)